METFPTDQQPPPGLIVRASGKLIAGLFLVVLGVSMALDNLGIVDSDRLWPYWPIVLILAGLPHIARRETRALATLSIVIGSLWLALNLHWLRVSLLDLGALLLIVAGALIVTRAVGIRPPFSQGPGATERWAVLSGQKVSVDSADFRGGRIFAFMGSYILDLTAADLYEGAAAMELVAIWGHIEIKVPEGWEVTGNTVPIMGGTEIETKGTPGGRQLAVNGLALMGGIEIKSVAGRTV
jgi:predicted membrane protein